jgi:hypothetical protein
MKEAIEQTGAVLMGRRTFEMGDPDPYVGNYEFQVPIFVLTHHPPNVAVKQDEHLTFTFVTDGVEWTAARAERSKRASAIVDNSGHTDSLNGKSELGLRVQLLRWAPARRTRILRMRELRLLLPNYFS